MQTLIRGNGEIRGRGKGNERPLASWSPRHPERAERAEESAHIDHRAMDFTRSTRSTRRTAHAENYCRARSQPAAPILSMRGPVIFLGLGARSVHPISGPQGKPWRYDAWVLTPK